MVHLIWAGLMLSAILFGILNGRAQEVTDALFSGAAKSAQLAIVLFGNMAFFSGIMRIGDESGITGLLARGYRPLLRLLFPEVKTGSAVAGAISMNLSANLLGLGNAATPFGLRAMELMNEENPDKGVASNPMVMFVVVNTASLQLIPASVAAIRASHGAESPLDILPAVWLSSVCSLIAGAAVVIVLNQIRFKKRKRPP